MNEIVLNTELLMTIVSALVLANLVNRVVVNPLLDRFVVGSEVRWYKEHKVTASSSSKG